MYKIKPSAITARTDKSNFKGTAEELLETVYMKYQHTENTSILKTVYI